MLTADAFGLPLNDVLAIAYHRTIVTKWRCRISQQTQKVSRRGARLLRTTFPHFAIVAE
jgi:hypothetical protein